MQHGVASLLLLSLIFFTQSSFTSGGKGDANGTKAPPVEGAVAANILKQSVPCEPWPYCVTSWVDSSLEERKRASSPLANILDAIKEGRERNCTQSAQCSPEERIEEIDSILKGVQQQRTVVAALRWVRLHLLYLLHRTSCAAHSSARVVSFL